MPKKPDRIAPGDRVVGVGHHHFGRMAGSAVSHGVGVAAARPDVGEDPLVVAALFLDVFVDGPAASRGRARRVPPCRPAGAGPCGSRGGRPAQEGQIARQRHLAAQAALDDGCAEQAERARRLSRSRAADGTLTKDQEGLRGIHGLLSGSSVRASRCACQMAARWGRPLAGRKAGVDDRKRRARGSSAARVRNRARWRSPHRRRLAVASRRASAGSRPEHRAQRRLRHRRTRRPRRPRSRRAAPFPPIRGRRFGRMPVISTVLLASGDVQEAVRIDRAEVTGRPPLAGRSLACPR